MSAQTTLSGIAANQIRPRAAALVGPLGCGKTTLFERLLAAAGSPVPPVSHRGVTIGQSRFKGEAWSLVDCSGTLGVGPDAIAVLEAVDIAVVVCEPAPERARALAPILAALDARHVPHLLFVNKVDTLSGRVRDTLAALQEFSQRPLVLRQVPICEETGIIGYVDVVSSRAYRYRPGEASVLFSLPARMEAGEIEAREALVEVLAEQDSALAQKILNDVRLSSDEIFGQLKQDQQSGAIVGVLLGAADREHGVRRLWKALRHDAPDPLMTAERRGVSATGEALLPI